MKLTRNIKILLLLISSSLILDFSNSLQTEALFANSNSNSNSLKASNSNRNSASALNKNTASSNLVGGIFSMKHKKIRASSSSSNKNTSTASKTKEKSRETSTVNSKVAATNTNNHPMIDDLMGANPDLLKQTNLLASTYAAGGKPPGFKKKIDLEKMGPIAFHSWVKFFKYNDQIATDKNALLKFNQNRKFFTNGEFREQLKLYPGEDNQEKDSEGEFKYVSDPQRFYLVAFKNLVVFYSTKIVNNNFIYHSYFRTI